MTIPHVLSHVSPYVWVAALLAVVVIAAVALLGSRASRGRLATQLAADRRAHEHLRMMLQQMPAIVWTVDASLRFTSIEGAGLPDLGNTAEEMVGKTLYEYFDTRDRAFKPIAAHEDAVRHQRNDTYEVTWHNRTYQVLVEPLRDAGGRVTGAIGAALDVTPRKAAELALSQSQARYAALLKAIPDLLFRLRSDGTIIEFIDNLAAPAGLAQGSHVKDVLPAGAADRLVERLRDALTSGQTQSFDLQYGQGDDARARTFEARLVAVAEDEVLAIVRNITDRKRAEDDLRSRESELRSVLSAIPDLIFQVTAQGRIAGCIASRPEELLMPPDQFLGRTVHEVLPPDVAQGIHHQITLTCQTRREHFFEYPLENHGTRQWYEARFLPCSEPCGEGQTQVIVLVRNITRLRNKNVPRGV
jgi:PAS domain S-box-containing protein